MVPIQNRPVHNRPLITDHVHNRPVQIRPLSKQTMFITDPLVTDHIDNGTDPFLISIAVWTLKVQTILPNTLCPVRP